MKKRKHVESHRELDHEGLFFSQAVDEFSKLLKTVSSRFPFNFLICVGR